MLRSEGRNTAFFILQIMIQMLQVILINQSPSLPLIWIPPSFWSKFPQALCFEIIDSKVHCCFTWRRVFPSWVFSRSCCDISCLWCFSLKTEVLILCYQGNGIFSWLAGSGAKEVLQSWPSFFLWRPYPGTSPFLDPTSNFCQNTHKKVD